MTSAFVFENGRGPCVLMPLMKLYGLCKEASALLGTRAELLLQHSLREDKFALMVTIRSGDSSSVVLGQHDKDPAIAINKMIQELETYLEDTRSEGKSASGKKSRRRAGRKNPTSKRSDGLRQG